MNNDGAAKAFGLKEGEGEARWWAGGLVTTKVTGKETGGLYSIVEVLEPHGAAAPLHVHHNEDEAFYILEGEMTFYVGEEAYKAGPGSFVFGPKDVPHTYTVDSGPAPSSCSSSRQQALRASSRRLVSRPRRAPCRPSRRPRPMRSRPRRPR